jgi:hypothetical protein
VLSTSNKAVDRVMLWKTHAHVVLRSKRVIIATKPVS